MMKTLSVILLLSFLLPFSVFAQNKKYVALTFDDGPHPRYTAEILKILYENDVKATFFVVGENAERYPELLRAEYDLGHEIGNHTYSHLRITENNADKIKAEIKAADDVIYDITGTIPSLFRPPEGKHGKKIDALIKSMDKTEVFWNIDTRDWAHTDKEKIIENIKKNIKDGSVILFHDYIAYPSPTPDVLREIIPYLKSQGYEFVTVGELYHINPTYHLFSSDKML